MKLTLGAMESTSLWNHGYPPGENTNVMHKNTHAKTEPEPSSWILISWPGITFMVCIHFTSSVHIQPVRSLVSARAYQPANSVFLSQQTSTSRAYQPRNQPTNKPIIWNKSGNHHGWPFLNLFGQISIRKTGSKQTKPQQVSNLLQTNHGLNYQPTLRAPGLSRSRFHFT